MEKHVRIQVKTLLAQRAMTIKDLAEKLTKFSGKTYSPNGISQRLGRGSLTYNEMLQIAEILGYKIEFIDKEIL